MTTIERKIIRNFKNLLGQRIEVQRLTLFGSRARGDADADSDLDILVVTKKPLALPDEDYISQCAWQAGFSYGIVVMPVSVSQSEWDFGPERYSLLAEAIRREGVPV